MQFIGTFSGKLAGAGAGAGVVIVRRGYNVNPSARHIIRRRPETRLRAQEKKNVLRRRSRAEKNKFFGRCFNPFWCAWSIPIGSAVTSVMLSPVMGGY